MKIVTVANRKGGTGKTTTCFNLGHVKASQKKRTLMIDLDSQGNLTRSSGADFIELDDLLTCRTKPVNKYLDVLPACKNYKAVEKAMNDDIIPTSFLSTYLRPNIKDYDYVLIDTSPTVNIVNTNGLLISDLILVVMQLDYYSMLGLSDMFEIITQVQRHNPNLEYLITVNQYQKNRNLNKAIENNVLALDNFSGVFIPHKQTIKENIAKHLPTNVAEYKELGKRI